MKQLFITICALLYVFTLSAKESSIYNILDYGAVADGKTLSTQAINNAITACNNNGGGKVYIPAGEFLSGTIFLKDNVELHLEMNSAIIASTNHDDFPLVMHTTFRSLKDWYGWSSLIYGDNLTNIAITGFGKIDGRGAEQFGRESIKRVNNTLDRDGRCRNILLVSCSKVRIEGISLYNSGVWNLHLLNSEDMFIDRIYVYNHANRNNDAIDIDGCRRVVLSNSIMDSDDDCLTLKGTGPADCEDITITNCVFASCCNGIKAGTESTGGFRNITISNCVVKPTKSKGSVFRSISEPNITGISLEIVDGGHMEGVSISNIVAQEVQCPIFIRLGDRARPYIEDAPAPQIGSMRNITIDNVIAYDSENFCSSITAVPGAYVENVTISNIQLTNNGGVTADSKELNGSFLADIYSVDEGVKKYPQPTLWNNLPSSAFFIRHAKNVIIKDVIVTPKAADPRTPIIAHDVKGLIIGDFILSENITAPLFLKGYDVENYKVNTPLGWDRELCNIEDYDLNKYKKQQALLRKK